MEAYYEILSRCPLFAGISREEMPEILGMSDRIVIMCNGKVTGELNRHEASQEGILELAMEKSK